MKDAAKTKKQLIAELLALRQRTTELETGQVERQRAEEALRVSEEKFSKAFRSSPDSITITTLAHGRYLDVNDSFLRITGYHRDEVIGHTAVELGIWATPEDRAQVRQLLQAQGEVRDLEANFRIKSGEVRVALLSAELIDIGGEPCILMVAHDITKRKRRERTQACLYKISEAAHAAHNLEELFRSIHGTISELIPAKNFYIALYDEATDTFSFPYFVDEHDAAPLPRKSGRGLTEYVLRTGEPLLAPPAVLAELTRAGAVDLIGTPAVDWLGVPLKTKDTTIGVLVIQSYTEGVRFAEEDKDILRFVSTQIAMAIERKRAETERESLLRAEREQRLLAETLAEVTLALTAQTSLEAVLDEILRQAQRLVPYSAANIMLFDGGLLRIARWQGYEAFGCAAFLSALVQSLTDFPLDAEAMRMRHPLVVPHTSREPHWVRVEETAWIRSHISVPICLRDRLLGLLRLDSHTPGDFSAQDAQRLQPLANAAAIALENARLHDQARREIDERKRTEAALRESEEKYRDLVENVNDIIYSTDERGVITYISPVIQLVGGYHPSEVIGRIFTAFAHPDDLPLVIESFQQTIAGHIRPREFRVLTKSGEFRWVRKSSRPVFVAGRLVGLRGVLTDITERKHAEEALKASEKRFRALIENSWEAVMLVNADGLITYASPSSTRVLGFTTDELVGRSSVELIHPESLPSTADLFARLLQTPSESVTAQVRCTHKDGSWRWIEGVGTNLLAEPGVQAVVVNYRDITERKQAEAALQESEAKFRTLAETAAAAIFIYRDRFCYVNPAAAAMTGYTQDELLAMNFWDVVHPDFRDLIRERGLARQRGESVPSRYEFKILTKNGEERWIDFTASFVEFDGHPAGLGTAFDITDGKRAEEALRESEERYRDLFENANDVIYTHDFEGHFTSLNAAAIKTYGYTRDQLLQLNISRLVDPDYLPIAQENTQKKRQGIERTEPYELLTYRKDGSPVWVEVNTRLIMDKGRPVGVQGVARDITERKRMEEELLKARKLESIGLLAGGIAHDFNNILLGILGNLSLAKMEARLGDKVLERLTAAEKAALRAKDLTQQLLTFSKGGAPIKKAASMAELIKDSAEFVLSGSNVQCHCQIPDNLWSVEVDEGQISQVIQNLLINADQAMPEGGTICVRAKNVTLDADHALRLTPGNYITVSIEDHGIGIPAEHLPKIFDPYFTTKQKGSGLGLATAYSIIKKHDGTITVESGLGSGTTFTIYLPASNARLPATTPVKREPMVGQGRILVMDDEEVIREVASQMLSFIGYEVELAKDGAEAIKLYRSATENGAPFDAVIMDLTVPGGMGGKEAVKRLREIDPQANVIASSGYSNDPIMADYATYGFDGVVAKPYRLEELSKVVHHVMPGKKERGPDNNPSPSD
jgi:PAS domain S-box-containing protein